MYTANKHIYQKQSKADAVNINLLGKHGDVVIAFTWWTEIERHTILGCLLNNVALQRHTLQHASIRHKINKICYS